jgi:hypothetical protein
VSTQGRGSCRCGARWTGFRTTHCGGCHATFGGLTVFDRHRRDGRCLNPAQLDGVELRNGAFRGPEAAPDVLAALRGS